MGTWTSILVCFLVGGRYLWAYSSRPAHRNEIAAAYGATRLIYGTVQPDPEGKRITYSQMSDKGIGVYLHDIQTGQKQLIHEKLPIDDEWRTLEVWPWSPDGRYFLYTQANLFVCDTHSTNRVTELPMEGGGAVQGMRNGVMALAWLTPTGFIYVSKLGNLHWYENADGHWSEKSTGGMKVSASSLTGLSSNTIAWHSGSGIWCLNLETQATRLLESQAGRIDGFSYSSANGRFLVNCTSNGIDSLWRLDGTSTSGSAKWENLPQAADIGTLSASQLKNASWLNEEATSWACLVPDRVDTDRTALVVHSAKKNTFGLFEHGKVDAFTASAKNQKLFVVGAISNEPSAGVWMYDAASGDLRCVTAYSDHPSLYAKRENALHGQAVSPAGRRVDFFLYRPADFDRRNSKSYPLVIGDTLYRTADPEYQNRVHGPLWAPMLANCGAYVVIVERATWMNGIGQWADSVQAVYQYLAHDTKVDRKRVFLYGTSLETSYLSELVEKDPELWKGLLLLNPSGLPDFTSIANGKVLPRVLVSAGGEEHSARRFENFRDKAIPAGAPVDVYEHSGSGHWLLGKTALDERSKAMVEFIFDE